MKNETTIPNIIKILMDKYNIKWSRISTSHHKFVNINKISDTNLPIKLGTEIGSLDFIDKEYKNNNKLKLTECVSTMKNVEDQW